MPIIHTGLEQLMRDPAALLGGRRVGLATHAAAVLPNLGSANTTLLAAGLRLTALFSPEHGLDGSAAPGATIAHAQDTSGIPIFSLYGDTLRPSLAMLEHIDVLVFDMQDVGARYYTYLSTLRELMLACTEAGLPLIVLDRPNPLGGNLIEGPTLEAGYESFVGAAQIPVRHAMTLGELALLLQAQLCPQLELGIVPMQAWRRSMSFARTGLPWVAPSPNMAHLDAVALYPGTCLLEGVNVSCGRGTALPFEVCGAPWLDGQGLAKRINALELPGVGARAQCFRPSTDRYAGQSCSGVQLHISNAQKLRPVGLGLHVLAALQTQHPDQLTWEAQHFDRLIGNQYVRQALSAGEKAENIMSTWKQCCARFRRERQPFLRY